MTDPTRFEGPTIEAVLADVRATLGADAEIVAANKVRSGGIGGFFAKESFEVLALPGSGTAPTAPEPADDRQVAGVLDLLGLADRVSEAEQRVASTPTSEAVTAPTPAPAHAPAQAPAPVGDRPRSMAEVVAQQAMLDGLRDAHRRGGPVAADEGGTAARMAAEDLAAVVQQAQGRGFEPILAEELPRLETPAGGFADVLQRMAADAGPEVRSAVDERIAEAMRARLAAADPTPEPVLGRSAPDAVEIHHPPAPVLGRSAPDAVEIHHPPAAEVDRTARLLSWLERDDLPRTTLVTALRGLPQMPALPDTAGLVIAVVGERQQALKLCRALARACDGEPGDVVLAAPPARSARGRAASSRSGAVAQADRIHDAADAARERLSWRRRPRPTFVAVECPPTLRGRDADAAHAWVRELVDALEAHRVIGVVGAARKVEDVARWVERVGGVDGLALQDLAESSTPYAVLALEIPVGYLGTAEATPATWAHALLEGAAA